nr:MAG TPA: protein of unknown function DUF604 [Caudoviricetes sp.]
MFVPLAQYSFGGAGLFLSTANAKRPLGDNPLGLCCFYWYQIPT